MKNPKFLLLTAALLGSIALPIQAQDKPKDAKPKAEKPLSFKKGERKGFEKIQGKPMTPEQVTQMIEALTQHRDAVKLADEKLVERKAAIAGMTVEAYNKARADLKKATEDEKKAQDAAKKDAPKDGEAKDKAAE